MTKQFSFKQLFSLTDGRLATGMDDVYDMLNHIFDDDFTTTALPIAYAKLKELNPEWFQKQKDVLEIIKQDTGNDFNNLMLYIDRVHNPMVDVPQMKDLTVKS